MRAFAQLYRALDRTRASRVRQAALADYFRAAPRADAAWGLWILLGGRLSGLVRRGELRALAARAAGLPLWIVEECHDAVGDLAETAALLIPDPKKSPEHVPGLAALIETTLLPLAEAPAEERLHGIAAQLARFPLAERFALAKCLTGALRVGVQRALVQRALAQVAGVEPARIAERLMGGFEPTATALEALLAGADSDDRRTSTRPYPFQLAHALEGGPESLEGPAFYAAEWKWDGIRAQIVRRGDGAHLWSRGEELISERWPEVWEAARQLPPGTVLDGELLIWKQGRPLGFAALQRRIGRKRPGARLRAELPGVFLAFDLLEEEGEDVRAKPFAERRARLERLLAKLPSAGAIEISEQLSGNSLTAWHTARAAARERGVEGLMLKRLDAPYQGGRPRGPFWKWKLAARTIDAVLIQAQRGHGRRADLYSDCTFGVWRGDELVPVAKAYSGLADAELVELDRFVRRNTLARYGPVRAVAPELVFEIAFEGIAASRRHKSGVAFRFPRIHRWRRDKSPAEADRLESLLGLLRAT